MIALQPLTQAEYGLFITLAKEDYAHRLAAETGQTIDQAREIATQETASLLPEGQSTPHHFFCGARSANDSELVGYLWWHVDAPHERAFLYQVYVLESHRRRGFGRAILEHLYVTLSAQGIRRIALHVFSQNPEAIALYEKQGYRVMSRTMIKLL